MTREQLKKQLEEKRNAREALADKGRKSNNLEELRGIVPKVGALNDEINIILDQLIEDTDKRNDPNYNERTAAVNAAAGYGEIPDIVRINARSQEQRNNKEVNLMNNDNIESRALQNFITKGLGNLEETEKRALDISGSAAALPTQIMDTLISSEKYSDLLFRSTIINQPGAGSIYIPVASNTAADWKIENSEVDISDVSYEKSPTLTKLELKGYELLRLMRVSAASYSMVAGNFINHLLQLLSGEVVETLEAAFIKGTGTGQPKGLDNLTWTPGTNQKLTATAATPITAADIAESLSLLPQKYARQAVVLVNSDMLYNIQMTKGTAEYAFDLANPTNTFLGKQVIVSEHMADDTVYIGDPSQIYVRFASPIQLEADKSSGFTAAAIDLRALTVVDAVINPAAWVAVGLGS